jgi:putative redox protein
MTELNARMDLSDGRVKFKAYADGKAPLTVDYIPPIGTGDGYTSLELLLISMGTCLGTGVKTLVTGRFNKKVEALSIQAKGLRRETHPTSFEEVGLTLFIEAPGLAAADLEGIIALAETKICPVLDMVKGNTKVAIEYRLNEGAALSA